ncbi:MAG: aldehyde ferredoxin oxidoreductase family protein [Desulfobacterales bacterium]|nr:aldehyde ferredoxin oxidoreductase family protein [Desulfobacterales bacterium]
MPDPLFPAGNILTIDLTRRKFQIHPIPENVLTDYLGGRGLGAYLLYQHTAAGVDPLSPENPLIFTVGISQGLPTPFSPKVVLTTKSPLTHLYLYSVSSGKLGHTIRKAGYMAIMIKGQSQDPVYLNIVDDQVEFISAMHLWGEKTLASQNIMLKESGNRTAATAAIGPGGEKLIKYASVMNDGKTYRAFGRGGAGCVMGAKKLKGIIISGSRKIPPIDSVKFKTLLQKARKGLDDNREWAQRRHSFGTGEDMPWMNRNGMLPTRNWQSGSFEEKKLADIAPTLNKDKWPRKNIACGPFCPNPCSHFIRINDGPYKGAQADGPEYETMYAFGSNCGIDKFDAIVAAGQICDENGVDTISAGLTISFLMECFEKGLVNTTHTDGISLDFGDDDAAIRTLEKIVMRDGAGYMWGEGTRRLAEQIAGSAAFAMHCKGLEMGGYEPRGFYGQALAFAINPKGGDHHAFGLPARSEAAAGTHKNITGKGVEIKKAAIDRIIGDSLVLCCFPRKITVPLYPDLIHALTGVDIDNQELSRIGWRILTVERLFNTREGLRRKDDTLPERLLKEPLPEGPNKGSMVPMEKLKDDAYAALGWEMDTGIPQKRLMDKLNIDI